VSGLIPEKVEASERSFPNNSTSIERVIPNREFNSLDENDPQVILAKAEGGNPVTPPTRGSGPSNFPTPPSGGRSSRPATGINPYSYRTPPKVVDQGLGAGANPAGAGGGAAEFDDNCPAPKKEQSQESKTFDYDYRSNDPRKKKQSAEQCELNDKAFYDLPEFGPIVEGSVVPVESLLGTSSGFKSQYKKLKKDSTANKQAASSIKKLAEGSLKIGDNNVIKITGMKKVYEAKTKYAKVYFQMDGDTVQIILAALKTDQKQSINLLKKYFK
jgi:putative component of toxin-antitoxin plasmid stabilization module